MLSLYDEGLTTKKAWVRGKPGVSVSVGCLWNTLRSMRLNLNKSRRASSGRTWPRRVRSRHQHDVRIGTRPAVDPHAE